jgi:hypothetical protein
MPCVRRLAPLLLLAGLLPGQEPGPADTRLDKANQQAAARVYRTFAKQGKMLSTQLKGLRKEDVIVVGGLFDFVQEVLSAYRLEHTVLTPAELEHHPLKEPERKIVFLNCHLLDRRFPPSQQAAGRASDEEARKRLERLLKRAGLDGADAPGRAIRERFAEVAHFAGSDYSRAGLERLGKAIRAGAWAVSTDWAVLALEKALPGRIRWTGRTTFEEKVEVRPSLAGRRHPLLKGVFPDPAKAREVHRPDREPGARRPQPGQPQGRRAPRARPGQGPARADPRVPAEGQDGRHRRDAEAALELPDREVAREPRARAQREEEVAPSTRICRTRLPLTRSTTSRTPSWVTASPCSGTRPKASAT